MSKLSYEDKVNLYNDKIKGIAIKSLGPKYGITYHNAQYLIRLIDKHGFDILTSDGMLCNWILKYKENGYNIVERKRGRPTMPKVTKKKENETDKEKIKRLEEENLYLKAELEYSKKLRAVVQARKNQQQKKK